MIRNYYIIFNMDIDNILFANTVPAARRCWYTNYNISRSIRTVIVVGVMINCFADAYTSKSALRTTDWCVIINNYTNHFSDTSFIIELIIDGRINYNIDRL